MSVIKKEEIISQGLFETEIKNALAFEKALKDIEEGYRDLLKVTKEKIIKADTNNAKGIDEQNKQVTKAKKALTELEKVERTRLQLSERIKNADSEQAKEVAKLREELKRKNKEIRDEVNLNSQSVGAYKKLSIQLNEARKRYKDLAAEEKENTDEAKKLLVQISSLDSKLKGIDAQTGQFQRNVGNYESAWKGLGSTLRNVAQAVGITFGVIEAFSFAKELNEISREARGVDFAFDRLGDRGVDAFNRIKESTRGTLSNLDIKKSINEFDNFNISLEETDTLFEFLAVRAAQTGKSVESLQSSLVEGLSKESKLRIDNLGISTQELNDELERTPDFVQAVANIAKREISEAGDILESTTSEQAKWNAELKNTKEGLARGLQPVIDVFFKSLNFLIKNFKTITKVIATSATGIGAYVLATKGATIAQNLWNKAVVFGNKVLKFFNTTLKANPIGLLVAGLTAAVTAFALFSDKAKESNKALEEFNAEVSKQQAALESIVIELEKENISNERRKELIGQINKINKEYNLTLLDENASIQDIKDNQKLLNNEIERTIAIKIKQSKIEEILANKIQAQSEVFQQVGSRLSSRSSNDQKEAVERLKALNEANIEFTRASNRIDESRRQDGTNFLKELNKQQKEELGLLKNTRDQLRRIVDSQFPELKGNDLVFRDGVNDFLSELTSSTINAEDGIKELSNTFDAIIDKSNSIEPIKVIDPLAVDLTKKTVIELRNLAKANDDLGKQAIAELKRRGLYNKSRQEELTKLQELQKQLRDTQKDREVFLSDPTKANDEGFIKLTDKARLLKAEIKELQDILNNLGDTEATVNVKIETEDLERIEAEPIQLSVESNEDDVDLSEIFRLRAEELAEEERIAAEKRAKFQEDALNTVNTAADAFESAEQERHEKALKRIDEEINARQQSADTLRELANQSSQSAIDNLAFENKKIAELERERAQEEARARKTELAIAAVRSYVSALEGGATPLEAIATSGAGVTALIALIESLPSFKVGTEDTGLNGKGVDGQGGFFSVLHPNERVMTKEQNAPLKGISNEELSYIGDLYNKGLMTPNEYAPMLSINAAKVDTKGIELAIKNGIKNIDVPVSTMEIDKIQGLVTQTIMSRSMIKKIKQKIRD